MDKGVIDLVNYFNSVGLTTYMSCEGHYPEKPHMAFFWISFSNDVTDQDIISFNKAYPMLNGWFVKKLIDETWLEWRYIAPNKEIAALDYQYLMAL